MCSVWGRYKYLTGRYAVCIVAGMDRWQICSSNETELGKITQFGRLSHEWVCSIRRVHTYIYIIDSVLQEKTEYSILSVIFEMCE